MEFELSVRDILRDTGSFKTLMKTAGGIGGDVK